MNDNDSNVVPISDWDLQVDHHLLSNEQFFRSLGVVVEIDPKGQEDIRADVVFFIEHMGRVQSMCTVAGVRLARLTEEQGEKAANAYEWDLSLEETVQELEELLSGEAQSQTEREMFLSIVLCAHIGQIHELMGLDDV